MSSQETKRTNKKKEDLTKNFNRWTNEGKALFVEILADTCKNVLLVIDKLALNCSSKKEVFGHIKSLFNVALREEAFIDKNEKENFADKKGNIKPYQKLDTKLDIVNYEIR